MYAIHDEFPQLPEIRYLNHAAVAPWPQRAVLAVRRFAEQNAQIGARDYASWLLVERSLRDRLARLLNAPSSADIALVKNTSEALSFVAFGLDWQPGDQVLISDEEFPSNRVVWEALKPLGVEVIQVNLHNGDPETNLLNACGPRTRLLSISAVQFASGLRLDLERLGHGCQQRGVLFCVDAIQQLGALPFDAQACQCAFAMADGHKWLLGPEGLGVFYCRSDLRAQLKLHEYGWHMLEHAGDYQRSDWQPARSARRFECGSPNMLGAMALEASLSLLEEVSMAEVGKALEARVQWLLDGLAGIPGVSLHSPRDPARRAGIVTFSLAGWDNQALFAQLKAAQVICAQRGDGIRLSPHFYSEARVIEETLQLLRQLATGCGLSSSAGIPNLFKK
ncbi:aminotransferase class V-fold PLP-dependent enzyme [Pseudomonas sp. UBA2684]|uniref:aminotransferase class V-fold PLP-dependent enzyme n=1 Tax=Pseudomonas sp. UBA2684 TaxID=1947311 RepID=UPI0025E3BDCD|nr:aminotransferase class V-fold PLP-dependent enzyme [Pseudomonas sp. UBA2684]|tara:strand:+ start:7358 stop:8536 length:1179 start_codon:yes stop_codon:yes gene_type:complete